VGRYVEAAWNNTHGAARAKVDVTAKVLGGCSPPVRETSCHVLVQIKRHGTTTKPRQRDEFSYSADAVC